MAILVTGSAGHLGEALMRTLPEAGYDAIGLTPGTRPSPIDSGRLPIAPLSGNACWSTRRPAHCDATQAARGYARTPGLCRHECHGYAQLARRVDCGRSERLHLYQHDERLRQGLSSARWNAGGVDHRRCRAGAEEHLRRYQGRGRKPVRAVPQHSRSALPHSQDVALLSGTGRLQGDSAILS